MERLRQRIRIPPVLFQFHPTPCLGIHIYRTAVIEIYPQCHMGILYRRTMVSDLPVLVGLVRHYLFNLSSVLFPEKAHSGLGTNVRTCNGAASQCKHRN